MSLINYIIQKGFDSQFQTRKFLELVFNSNQASTNDKLNLYLTILDSDIKTSFIDLVSGHNDSFCIAAYTKLVDNFDKEVFKSSRELELLFKMYAPSLAISSQHGINSKRKCIAKKLLNNGLIVSNYEQIINPQSKVLGV